MRCGLNLFCRFPSFWRTRYRTAMVALFFPQEVLCLMERKFREPLSKWGSYTNKIQRKEEGRAVQNPMIIEYIDMCSWSKNFQQGIILFSRGGVLHGQYFGNFIMWKNPICTSAEMFWNLNNWSIIFNSIHNLWKVLYCRQHCLNGEYQLVLPVYYLVIVSSNINVHCLRWNC